MVARLPGLLVPLALGFFAFGACGACGEKPPAAPVDPARPLASAPPAVTSPPQNAKKTAAEHHRDFMSGCARRSLNSPEYCECAWAQFHEAFADDDLDGREADRAKVDHVKAQVLAACASLVSEDLVRADFAKACGASKSELKPYCDCTWTELRKKFSPAELGDDATVASARFDSGRAAATKTCGNKMSDALSRDAFLKTCAKDPGDATYCDCAWKELRKQASPGEIEAGTFDQKTLFSHFEKTCGKLRTAKTAP